jgi:H+/Cl- antiporter ClcA
MAFLFLIASKPTSLTKSQDPLVFVLPMATLLSVSPQEITTYTALGLYASFFGCLAACKLFSCTEDDFDQNQFLF